MSPVVFGFIEGSRFFTEMRWRESSRSARRLLSTQRLEAAFQKRRHGEKRILHHWWKLLSWLLGYCMLQEKRKQGIFQKTREEHFFFPLRKHIWKYLQSFPTGRAMVASRRVTRDAGFSTALFVSARRRRCPGSIARVMQSFSCDIVTSILVWHFELSSTSLHLYFGL